MMSRKEETMSLTEIIVSIVGAILFFTIMILQVVLPLYEVSSSSQGMVREGPDSQKEKRAMDEVVS